MLRDPSESSTTCEAPATEDLCGDARVTFQVFAESPEFQEFMADVLRNERALAESDLVRMYEAKLVADYRALSPRERARREAAADAFFGDGLDAA